MTNVQTLGRRQLTRDVQDSLAHVYLAAYGDPGFSESGLDAEYFASSTVPRHARRDGFRLVLADDGSQVIGYGYGFTGKHGQFWSDWLARTAPADVVETWVGDHFELVDIVVDPQSRGQGVAGQVLDALVAGLPHQRALLAVEPGDNAPSRLYVSRGWQVLVPELDGAKALYGLDLSAQ